MPNSVRTLIYSRQQKQEAAAADALEMPPLQALLLLLPRLLLPRLLLPRLLLLLLLGSGGWALWEKCIHKGDGVKGLQVINAFSHSNKLDGHSQLIHHADLQGRTGAGQGGAGQAGRDVGRGEGGWFGGWFGGCNSQPAGA
jgi:hypothetical protein